MLHPVGTRRLFAPRGMLDYGKVANGMNIDGDGLRQSLRPGPLNRILWQQIEISGRVQVVDDGKRLCKRVAVYIEYWHQALWIASQVFGCTVGSGNKVDRHGLVGNIGKIQRAIRTR